MPPAANLQPRLALSCLAGGPCQATQNSRVRSLCLLAFLCRAVSSDSGLLKRYVLYFGHVSFRGLLMNLTRDLAPFWLTALH